MAALVPLASLFKLMGPQAWQKEALSSFHLGDSWRECHLLVMRLDEAQFKVILGLVSLHGLVHVLRGVFLGMYWFLCSRPSMSWDAGSVWVPGWHYLPLCISC